MISFNILVAASLLPGVAGLAGDWPPGEYCDASGGCVEHIARVQLGDLDNASGCDQYRDYTSMMAVITIGLPRAVTVTNGHAYSADVCSIWVDWNQDGVFDDTPPELIGDQVGGGVSPPYSMQLAVPDGVSAPAFTRMRIRIDFANPDPEPCGTTSYGEVEDYTLLVAGDEFGACCNIQDGTCLDDYSGVDCVQLGSAWQIHYFESCATLDPPCGDPGCCCDEPEPGAVTPPHFAYRANCTGRFLASAPGMDCIATAFEPPCGLWQTTALLYAPASDDNPGFRAAVSELLGAPVVYLDARLTTPTLEELEPYVAVLTWVYWPYADPFGMGDVLADYVDVGGRVILGQWTAWTDAGNHLFGRIMTPEYCPAICTAWQFNLVYSGDGATCPHQGPLGEVVSYAAQYADLISGLQPDAVADGHWTSGQPTVVYRPDTKVFYCSGHTGGTYSSGDWPLLTANIVVCQASGACCHVETAECLDGVPIPDCLAGGPAWRPHPDQQCASLNPPCGNPGACCETASGVCVDGVLEAVCGDEFHAGQNCAALVPPCGNPGACCEEDSGVCVDGILADACALRFVAGTLCADMQPPCGEMLSVLYAPSNPDDEGFRYQLESRLGGPVDYFDPRAATPSLDQLLQYDCVMTWANYPYQDARALGDVLADYVDAGGRVILGQWSFLGLSGTPGAGGGRILQPEYCPVASISTGFGSGSYAGDGSDCVNLGIIWYDTNYLDVISALSPGAQADGTFLPTETPAVTWRPDRRVYYSPGNTGGEFGAGQWADLTANMCRCQVPHITGDLSCDGAINAFDIDPFVLALTSPVAYEAQYWFCDQALADCNGDGVVNAFDIDPFVALLVGAR